MVADSKPKPIKNDGSEIRIILNYNIQHKKFEKIIMKHWDILKKDRVLGTVLPSRPRFIYRRAPTLRDVLALSVVDLPVVRENRIFYSLLIGFYACGKCPPCKKCRHNVKRRKNFVAPTTGRIL